MFKSVRFKLTFWYALALSITLSIFSVIVYRDLSENLYGNMDMLLQFRAEGLTDALEAYLETEEIEVGRFPASASKNSTFFKIVQPLVSASSYDPKLSAIEIRILDAAGAVLAASLGAPAAPDLPESTLAEALKGNAVYDTFKARVAGNKEDAFRSYATPARGDNKTVYIVQAWRPMYQTEFALAHLRTMMAFWVPLIVLLTGAAGMFFARVAFKPVRAINSTIRQITAENLKLRLAPPDTRDEIRELADIFNSMLARLEDSFLSQKRFIQDVSHELRTPLTIIKGELEVALKKARSAGEYAAILQSNLEEMEKIARIVENLLTLAKFDNREVRLDLVPLELGPILETLAGDLAAAAGRKKISLELAIAEDGLEVTADPGQLRRAFLNILDNAVKYSREGGKIKVTAARENGEVTVTIADDGPGIAAADLPHIFKRFYRADASRSNAGFGLGLAIVKTIMEAHGAGVELKSEPQKGSAFTIRFSPKSRH